MAQETNSTHPYLSANLSQNEHSANYGEHNCEYCGAACRGGPKLGKKIFCSSSCLRFYKEDI